MDAVGGDGARSEAVKADERDNEHVNSGEAPVVPDDGIKVDSNGDLSHEERQRELDGVKVETPAGSTQTTGASPQTQPGINGDATGLEKPNDSPSKSSSAGSPPSVAAADGVAGTPTPTKGRGLRKWRRIRRDATKEGSVGMEGIPGIEEGIDSGRVMKRGAPVLEAPKFHVVDDEKPKSDEPEPAESSVASVDDIGRFGNISGANSPPPPVQGLDPELESLVSGAGFALGTVDSDNSEDRSSRSSASVSFPRQGYDGFGFGRERNKTKNLRARGGHIPQQKGHRGKSVQDGGKKGRGGDRFGHEKDVSRSSVESDLRSTKAVIAQMGSSTSNGQCSTGSVNFEKENNSGVHAGEDARDGSSKDNGGATDRLNRQELHDNGFHGAKAEVEENLDRPQHNTDEDPFLHPIAMLQAAQEALEKEIEKFAEVGDDDSVSLPGNSCEIASEETEGISSQPLDSKVLYLCKRVEDLENELKEASVLVEAKEAKIQDMEANLNNTELHGKKSHDLQERCNELELELEALFQKNFEVEIEHLTLKRATQLWKVTVEDEWAFLKEQRFLGEEYDKLVLKLREAEDKATRLNSRATLLEASCEVLERKVGLLTLQTGASKLSLCLFLQLFILCVALWLFLMQLLPLSVDDVPT